MALVKWVHGRKEAVVKLVTMFLEELPGLVEGIEKMPSKSLLKKTIEDCTDRTRGPENSGTSRLMVKTDIIEKLKVNEVCFEF